MRIVARLLTIVAIFFLTNACDDNYEHLSYDYYSDDGSKVIAVYHNPRESAAPGSIYSVTLTLPDGTSFTLPQAFAASGVRYSDEKTWLWWTKGDGAFLEKALADGSWQSIYPDLVSPAPNY